MASITVTTPLSADDRALLEYVLGGSSTPTAAPAEEKPEPKARKKPGPKPKKTAEPEGEPAPHPMDDAEETQEPEPEEPGATTEDDDSEDAAESAEDGDGATVADAVKLATKLVSSGKSPVVKKALKAVGAKRVSEIGEDDVATFMEALGDA